MNNRHHLQSIINNSQAIREEIRRFESVHPSIYAIYDLIELIPDSLIAQQIRDHVVCIEDSFVNSQEWTVSRGVPDLRLGIVGSLSSGKSALVHRYLTGSYMQEESPEGGRFKKEVLMDGHSHLLLIRDEGGPPELQFTAWVDAVIFVFSLENEASFNAIYTYYTQMAHYRNSSEIPLILVGTQDAISESNPRIIDDARARKLANDLKRCSYYETCATYGLNVERVFQDACQKIVQQRLSQSNSSLGPSDSRPTTPIGISMPPLPQIILPNSPVHSQPFIKDTNNRSISNSLSTSSHTLHKELTSENNNLSRLPTLDNLTLNPNMSAKDLPTPSSTPTATRKNRRRSNLFTPSKKGEDKLKNGGELGSGRAIPVKQGVLYKKSSKALNKEWKKKYVTLCDDGRLTYHPSLHDYMEDVHGKEIPLQYVTVKVPGQKPRGSKTISQSNGSNEALSSITNFHHKEKKVQDKVTLTAFEMLKEPGRISNNDDSLIINNSLSVANGVEIKAETPNVKKRHRRIKSSSVKNHDCDDTDGYEFLIVSLDNKQWNFEAGSYEERDEWVTAIENQILNTLQSVESSKGKLRLNSSVEAASIQSIKNRVQGNGFCADCDAPNPDWASLNLGILLCIECSGIHRNLGSHISKVRSLTLDEWPAGHLSVMLSIGNRLANSIWEGDLKGRRKPTPTSNREEKERWAASKYITKEFLPPLESPNRLPHHIFDAVTRNDMRGVIDSIVRGESEIVNSSMNAKNSRTPLQVACSMGNLAIAQILLWYNADVTLLDSEGNSCLSLARSAARGQSEGGASSLVDLLLSVGCPDISSTII
uniref:Centaurin-gamma-1A n=1 Tax=Lygus hesperus TaxID=30085 RepID=A0A146KXR8_LYGHE